MINTDCHSSISTFTPANSNPELPVFISGFFSSCPKPGFVPEETLPSEVPEGSWSSMGVCRKPMIKKQTVEGHDIIPECVSVLVHCRACS